MASSSAGSCSDVLRRADAHGQEEGGGPQEARDRREGRGAQREGVERKAGDADHGRGDQGGLRHPHLEKTLRPMSIMKRVTVPVAEEKFPMNAAYALGSGKAAWSFAFHDTSTRLMHIP